MDSLHYGHRFNSIEIAQAFVDYCQQYAGLKGHVLRKGREVGVDFETGLQFNSMSGNIYFCTMTVAFDAGVEACQQTHCEE
jgi:hypothetical protein